VTKEQGVILKDKVIIVTGVGPGMGRKLCLEAAKEGASVALSARSMDFVNSVAAEVEAAGGKALPVRVDVSSFEDCERIAAATVERFGRVDGLVNSAYQTGQIGPFEEADFGDWQRTINVTLFGALRMVKAVLPHMKAQGGGAIVNIGTMETRRPLADHGAYVAAKSALQGATRHLAVDLGRYNIRVNAAVMGWMWGTPVETFFREEAKKTNVPIDTLIAQVTANIPLRRIPPDQECARTALMFLSDYTSQVTGTSLDINGGDYMSS
jgi:NAD(P)-dependent dehydrogenase (short-subunit alcohol dehydrogenase family)